jgi:hypothetical protein
MKKTILISIFCLLAQFSQAQSRKQIGLEDLGKIYYSDVKNSQSLKPCEESSGKSLTYCVGDGSKISYVFTNYKLTSIIYFTAYPSKYKAETELVKVINEQSRNTGIQPSYSNGLTLFKRSNSNIVLAFQVLEAGGTYYLANYYTLVD